MFRPSLICITLFLGLTPLPAAAQDAASPSTISAAKLGTTRNVHAFGSTLLCGQPTVEEFAEAKQRGIQVVITLREGGELDWDEGAALKQMGLEFHSLGFRRPESLTNEIIEKSLQLLKDSDSAPVMLHCASANRVGAIWLVHRVLNDGLSIDAATKEAKAVGLRTPEYETVVLEYIKSRSTD